MKKTNKNHNGRSMVEMLGVLAIIGVLSIGGIAGYSLAMQKYKINKTVESLYALFDTLDFYINFHNDELYNLKGISYSSNQERNESFNFDDNSVVAMIIRDANITDSPFTIQLHFDNIIIWTSIIYKKNDTSGIKTCETIVSLIQNGYFPEYIATMKKEDCSLNSTLTLLRSI